MAWKTMTDRGFFRPGFNSTGERIAAESIKESRNTEIEQVTRDDGRILMQGIEQGRAFSLSIEEDIGLLIVARPSSS